ncbi:hypothetical protein [Pantoea sp. GM01]|uniref:hypothetical protein n=1 Tax=Pantoea sp. GM01 TaxID=1144320 RepID=UPI000270E15E|nr:hypothetical protein [Pantoea sp. GM01]EJL93118.1 hypothetical protein PMI17_00387 [Pantoea sp. GM01]
MTPISVPPQHVTYTVKQSGWISPSQWHSFTLAVTEAFWLLPVHLRPCSPTDGTRLERASMMFTHPGAFEFDWGLVSELEFALEELKTDKR